MTDRDIVERVAQLIGGRVEEKTDKRPKRKRCYTTFRTGPSALEVALTVYPWLGVRRRQKVDEALGFYERTDG